MSDHADWGREQAPCPTTQAILSLIWWLGDTWRDINPSTTAAEEQALVILTRAGLIEQSVTIQARMAGRAEVVQAACELNGNYSISLQRQVLAIVPEWQGKPVDSLGIEAKTSRARLTEKGVLARRDVASGEDAHVIREVLAHFKEEWGRARLLPSSVEVSLSDTEPAMAIPADEEQPAAAVLGVSFLDVARAMNDGDEQSARETKERWKNSSFPKKPESIGYSPEHSQLKLFSVNEACEYAKLAENLRPDAKQSLLRAVRPLARPPRDNK